MRVLWFDARCVAERQNDGENALHVCGNRNMQTRCVRFARFWTEILSKKDVRITHLHATCTKISPSFVTSASIGTERGYVSCCAYDDEDRDGPVMI